MNRPPELTLPVQPEQSVVKNGVESLESLICFAIESKVDVSTLERLIAMREKVMAERAKAKFDAAMAAFQRECPIIKKEKPGPNNSYKYAPLEDVVAAVKEKIYEHGFSYSIDSTTPAQDWIEVSCRVTHRGGHSAVSSFKIPTDQRNRMMSDPQRYLGSLTFAKRVAFMNAFGIVASGEDKDGVTKHVAGPGPAVATAKTRERMIERLKDIEQQAYQYAIDRGLIMPNQPLTEWPLSEVPTTREALETLRGKILRHQ